MVAGRRRRQAIIQLHARAPFDLRVLRRQPPPRNAKALAVFARAATNLHSPADTACRTVDLALSLLLEERAAGAAAWGYPFDVQTRWSFYPAYAPNIIVTAFAVRSLRMASRRWSDRPRWSQAAHEAAGWLLDHLRTKAGFFAYHERSETLVHNANVLGAQVVWEALGDRDAALAAVEHTLRAQRSDGSWPYGAGRGLAFVDSFHTGFVLDGLATLSDLAPAIVDAVRRGAEYYERSFFDEAGAARLFAHRPYPHDAHSAGTGMTTLATLCGRGWASPETLALVSRRVLDTGLRGGHAVHRRYRRHRTSVRYIRWADAHVALGLADAANALFPPAPDRAQGG